MKHPISEAFELIHQFHLEKQRYFVFPNKNKTRYFVIPPPADLVALQRLWDWQENVYSSPYFGRIKLDI